MAVLILEDGSIHIGECFGAKQIAVGEVVFNTGMAGYQEVLTDPSYCGQIVNMTYPLIGNYGINDEDSESDKPQVSGFIVREYCEQPSNWKSQGTLDEYLKHYGISAIYGLDTRSITKIIREKGTMKGIITPEMPSKQEISDLLLKTCKNPVEMVTAKSKYTIMGNTKHIAVIDFGMKRNILNSLKNRGYTITVYPASTSAEEILSDMPDGIVLSNGPGDPKDNLKAINTIRELTNKKPIIGICLGHQLLALASGADTEKLKYGHRGSNHPVVDIKRDRVYITSQNHGYTIIERTLDANRIEITHRNLNDSTIEGFRFKDMPVFSVQFHPEANPGPKDTAYLFDQFFDSI